MERGPTTASPGGEVTQTLRCAGAGDRAAYDRLFSLAYDELRRIAARQLRRRDARLALDSAELVNELYLKLRDRMAASWSGRRHFYAVAARAMRQILVDLARRRAARKRGGTLHAAAAATEAGLDGGALLSDVPIDDVLALDQLLARLDARQRTVVECRFFAGLSEDETARSLGVSTRTVQRDWTRARERLHRALYPDGATP